MKNKLINLFSFHCFFALGLVALLCLPVTLQAQAKLAKQAEVRQNYQSGLFVQSLTGIGGAEFVLGTSDQVFNSMAYHTILRLGWVVWKDLVVYGGVDYTSTSTAAENTDPTYGVRNGFTEVDQELEYRYASFISGASYYFLPPLYYINADLRVTLGGSYTLDRSLVNTRDTTINKEDIKDSDDRITPRVIGFGLGLGREWLINNSITIGLTFYYVLDILYAGIDNTQGLAAQNSYYSFNVSISYNH